MRRIASWYVVNRERVTEGDYRRYHEAKTKYRLMQLWRIASIGNIPLGTVRVIAANEKWLEEKFGSKEGERE